MSEETLNIPAGHNRGPMGSIPIATYAAEEVAIPTRSPRRGRGIYGELAETLKALPDGRALRLPVAPGDNPKSMYLRIAQSFRRGRRGKYGLKFSARLDGDHVICWENRSNK